MSANTEGAEPEWHKHMMHCLFRAAFCSDEAPEAYWRLLNDVYGVICVAEGRPEPKRIGEPGTLARLEDVRDALNDFWLQFYHENTTRQPGPASRPIPDSPFNTRAGQTVIPFSRPRARA